MSTLTYVPRPKLPRPINSPSRSVPKRILPPLYLVFAQPLPRARPTLTITITHLLCCSSHCRILLLVLSQRLRLRPQPPSQGCHVGAQRPQRRVLGPNLGRQLLLLVPLLAPKAAAATTAAPGVQLLRNNNSKRYRVLHVERGGQDGVKGRGSAAATNTN